MDGATGDAWDSAVPADLKRTRRKKQVEDSLEKLPPNSPEAEAGALGCIMLSPLETMPDAIEKFRDNGVEFYDLKHLTIWEALVALYDRNTPIDVISLQNYLKEQDMLEQVGGIAALASLPDSVPSAANLSYYLDIIVEKYILRRAIQTCTEVVARVYDYEGEVDSLMDQVELDLISIRERRIDTKALAMRELIQENIRTIEAYNERAGALTGLGTGFSDFDKMTSGLQPADMVVIAARPSMGKTSLAMNIVEEIAVGQNLPVGVFSLEMSAPALTLRMLSSRARVNLRTIRDGYMAERDMPKLVNAAGKLAKAPIYIDDSAGLTILQLRSKARRMKARYDIKALVIDFLQLLRSSKRKVDSRQEEVGDIARNIKGLAKELGIPIIAVSQLNRELEKDKKRKPRMSDLRESGEIEQVADVIGLLYRPFVGDDDVGDENYFEAVPVNLLIGKNRNGPQGEVALTFLKTFTRFENAAMVSDQDVPEEPQQREFYGD